MKKSNIHTLVLSGILTALVFAVTSFTKINIPLPLVKGAYFHAGDSMIFLSAMLLGPSYGALVSGIGSFFADLYLGSPQYMLATLIIKGIMGLVAGYFLYSPKGKTPMLRVVLGLVISSLWMSITYYLYEVMVLSIDALINLPGLLINMTQGALGIIIYLPLAKIIATNEAINRSV